MLFLASMDDKDAAYMGGVFALVRVSSGCRFETVKNGKIDVFCTLAKTAGFPERFGTECEIGTS